MSGFIKEFYYGNIEPQEFSPELAAKLKSKLNALVENEKALDCYNQIKEKYQQSLQYGEIDKYIEHLK